MYVNEIGVVGVGEVLEEYDRKSSSGTEWLVYGPGSNGFGTEHRIRVNWYKDLRYNPISYSKLKSVKTSSPTVLLSTLYLQKREFWS